MVNKEPYGGELMPGGRNTEAEEHTVCSGNGSGRVWLKLCAGE